MYYSQNDIRNLTYSDLDPIYFLAFLSDVKINTNVKKSSYSHISKYYNIIKYGLQVVNKWLSVMF